MISDITDGAAYRQLLQPGQFLHQTSNITSVMNTDGVNLYSSSRVELWPIFLVINEMSPGVRFARENMLLAGVWQGKGKPPFQQYFHIFSDKINSLKEDGVNITVNSEEFCVKVSVVCATLDLPAKANVLNMTFFNGSHACVTCEEPGVVVAQGKGHSRCYPYRSAEDRLTTRSCDSVKVSMEQATHTVRDKGFCGPSGLMHLNGFDLVWGTVPDYMHGILLGVTKTLLCKWLSPTQSTQPYFVGKSLREISTRLRNICPPDCIERLPRDLEKNYNHLKATELQTWLLFYCVPCLSGILPNNYLGHIAKLSEAAHTLLGDGISSAALARAEILLDQFYEEFEGLYGSGSCGLNVHNAGFHLVEYVRRWGPMWAWSCFAFEDANAMVLQSVHGTGDVLNQIMRLKLVQAVTRKSGQTNRAHHVWAKTKPASNCTIAGKPHKLSEHDLDACNRIMQFDRNLTLLKIKRIIVNGHRFHSADYSRMKKRECSVVLLDGGQYGQVQFFIQSSENETVSAVVLKLEACPDNQFPFEAGKHFISVQFSQEKQIVPVEMLLETMFCIQCTPGGPTYLSRVPNKHGHSIFK